MTTYYISATTGSDSNNGLGPDASHATNKPWLTIGKALGASGIASGDTVYLAPGTYREAITVAMTSATADTSLIGDPTNAQGFKTSGGVLLSAGEIIWTAFTTSDTTGLASAAPLILNGCDFLSFQRITFVGGNVSPSCVNGNTQTSTDITFTECAFFPQNIGGNTFEINSAADVILNWTIDRCLIVTARGGRMFSATVPTGTADWDANVLFRNCLMLFGDNASGVSLYSSGATAGKPGGVRLQNCTTFSGRNILQTFSANFSTSIPCTAYNCQLLHCTTALNANTSGQIVEDYNRIISNTPRTNVSTGANSQSSTAYPGAWELGQYLWIGRQARPPFTPLAGSPLLGFGNQTGAPTVDMANRPRPAGGGSTSNAVGAFERHQTAARETTTTQAGTSAIKITGPGDHDLVIPVDASSTSLSVYVRYDTTHGTTNKPQAQLLANGAIGVTGETKTATVGVDTWEQLTFSSFTPTAKGAVTMRLISRAAGGAGVAYFDTVAGGVNSTGGFEYFRAGEPLSTTVAGSSGGGLIGGGTLTGGTQ